MSFSENPVGLFTPKRFDCALSGTKYEDISISVAEDVSIICILSPFAILRNVELSSLLHLTKDNKNGLNLHNDKSNLRRNLAIANRSRVSCAWQYIDGVYSNSLSLKSGLEVIRGHWKLGCIFLFDFCSNYGAIMYRLRDRASYKFLYQPVFSAPAGGDPVGILRRYYFDVSINQNDWATMRWRNYDNMLSRFDRIPERDGRRDGQTDGHRIAISISRVSVLMCNKNQPLLNYSALFSCYFYCRIRVKSA